MYSASLRVALFKGGTFSSKHSILWFAFKNVIQVSKFYNYFIKEIILCDVVVPALYTRQSYKEDQ